MHTSSGQSSLFVQFPSNLPVAQKLLNKGTGSSNLDMEQKQGDDARLRELKHLLGFQGAWKAYFSQKVLPGFISSMERKMELGVLVQTATNFES